MKNRIPAEIVASVLAATTVLLSLPPVNLPPWAVFVAWAGCFAMGGPTAANMKTLWKTMWIGSTYAAIIVLILNATTAHMSFWGSQWMTMATIFVLNTGLMFTGRIKAVSFVPGMFFGFASYFATVFGGWSWSVHNPYTAWVAVLIMNAIGPAYAWLNVKLSFPVAEAPRAHPTTLAGDE
ncbi:MAG TPA: DUF1097 domain-containing protein [Bacillota bacterium]|nr:DUF1097 domain-containing protein [Bacillota bacterium]